MFAKSCRFFTAVTMAVTSVRASVTALMMNETLNMAQNVSSSTGAVPNKSESDVYTYLGISAGVCLAVCCCCIVAIRAIALFNRVAAPRLPVIMHPLINPAQQAEDFAVDAMARLYI